MSNLIYSINGPIVTIRDTKDFSMMEMVYVGEHKLLGEVIGVNDRVTTIQVYESTTGLKCNEEVISSGSLLSANLGPGLLNNIFDGVLRPLRDIEKQNGHFLGEGNDVFTLDLKREWEVQITVKLNDQVVGGDIYATTQETSLIQHRCMIPPYLKGKVVKINEQATYHVNDVVVLVEDENQQLHELTLVQKWPIRKSRPVIERLPISRPLITGQRVIDAFFPIAKGGAAAIPGGFGTGKTMTQHQLAKYCDADIIVYVGCGERGNEMTQVLQEFSELVDPKSQQPLMNRTILIANTSNMPVAAREASIYTGVALGEYYRDMGYHVALMADSTSRWAEALREISGRLEEMPAEEGFPAYLPSRIAQFYERSGYVKTLNNKEGSLTLIGAVSPQGADFSEPVTQNTKRFVRTFWALDKSLAYARHYPAINWIDSYSEYVSDLSRWYDVNVDYKFNNLRKTMVAILQKENQLNEIVKLIGADVLPDDQKLTLEIAKVIRVGFLQQNAFHPEDTFVPFEKQFLMLDLINYANIQASKYIDKKVPISLIVKCGVFDLLIKIKYDIKNNEMNLLKTYYEKIDSLLSTIE
ncbi:MAG: V-type ATP synthase subunit A [Erysipelotrichaceae bacterium]